MAYDTGEKYLKEIDHVSILEPIDEVFDGATSLLSENAVMYGSTITSIIAGVPIVGDLDVAVSKEEYMKLCQNFANSVKWLQVQGKTIPERRGSPELKKYHITSSSPPMSSSNPYKKDKHLPIDSVVAFHTVNGTRVQIVQSKIMTGDPLEDALEVVRKVDFAFCDMALDRWGRMLETIPHAYSDCLARVIRIHEYQHRLDPARLKQRINKYVKRGWSLTFSIDQAMINLKRAKAEYAKRPKKKKKNHGPKKVSGFRIKKSAKRGYTLETVKDFLQMVREKDYIRDVVKHYGRDHGIVFNSTTNKYGRMEFWASSKNKEPLDLKKARRILVDVDNHLRSRHSSVYEKMRQSKKKDSFAKLYGYPGGGGMKKGEVQVMHGYVSNSTTSSSNW